MGINPGTSLTSVRAAAAARSAMPRDGPERRHSGSLREGQRTIFGEDLEMLERQQQNPSAKPDRKLMRLNIDAGGSRSRLAIDRAIASS